jgi:hypothetical protein
VGNNGYGFFLKGNKYTFLGDFMGGRITRP